MKISELQYAIKLSRKNLKNTRTQYLSRLEQITGKNQDPDEFGELDIEVPDKIANPLIDFLQNGVEVKRKAILELEEKEIEDLKNPGKPKKPKK